MSRGGPATRMLVTALQRDLELHDIAMLELGFYVRTLIAFRKSHLDGPLSTEMHRLPGRQALERNCDF